MASLPYPRRPPNSFHRTHSKFVCASPPTEFTEFTEISGGGYSPTDFTEYTEASGGEYPPTDFTDVHRFFFSASRFCVFREFCGKIVLWLRGYGRDAIPTQPSEFFPQNHSEFACASPPTEFTEFTEASGGGYSPPVVSVFREFCGKIVWAAAWVWQGCHTLLICAHLCNLWEDIPHLSFLCSANSVGR